jgi:translation initiation factor 2 subunit 1
MLYTKDGYPEVNEIVKCTVIKIYGNTTFVRLDEYEKEGVLTIAEIAPGRIRNLRDHVTENKVIICKVLRVDEKNKRVDISLRRVPIPVMKDKLEELKKEEFAEKLYTDISKELKITNDELFEKTYEPIFEEYETVFESLYEIMLDNTKVKMFTKLSSSEQESFARLINEKIKPEEVVFKEKFKVHSLAQDGVVRVKEALKKSRDSIAYEKVEIQYLAAGTYSIVIKHDDMRSASKLFTIFKTNLEEQAKEQNLQVQIKE